MPSSDLPDAIVGEGRKLLDSRTGESNLAPKAARNVADEDDSIDGEVDYGVEAEPARDTTPPPPTPDSIEALNLARRIVDLAADKLASDIVLLDIRGVSLIADYFVIATVGSDRQAAAILNDLGDRLLEEFGRKPLHTEGKPDSGWVLLDFGDVIVHVFSPVERTFYNLEQLWSAATPIVRLQ
jgi:ribosome-associated protein